MFYYCEHLRSCKECAFSGCTRRESCVVQKVGPVVSATKKSQHQQVPCSRLLRRRLRTLRPTVDVKGPCTPMYPRVHFVFLELVWGLGSFGLVCSGLRVQVSSMNKHGSPDCPREWERTCFRSMYLIDHVWMMEMLRQRQSSNCLRLTSVIICKFRCTC